MYLIIGKVDGNIESENGRKYLVFDSTDEKREVLKRYTELWNAIKNEIEKINGGKKGEHSKDFMKTKFVSDDDLPLNKQLKLHMLAINVRSVFEKSGKFCVQLYLYDYVCMNYKNAIIRKNLCPRRNWY